MRNMRGTDREFCRGEKRRCEFDGAILTVFMLVGHDEDPEVDSWEVYMACPICGALYMEVGPVLGVALKGV